MERLLTTQQAAELLGLSEQTLRNWRTTGGGPPAVKVGRNVRYRGRDLERWLDEHTELRTPMPGGAA